MSDDDPTTPAFLVLRLETLRQVHESLSKRFQEMDLAKTWIQDTEAKRLDYDWDFQGVSEDGKYLEFFQAGSGGWDTGEWMTIPLAYVEDRDAWLETFRKRGDRV